MREISGRHVKKFPQRDVLGHHENCSTPSVFFLLLYHPAFSISIHIYFTRKFLHVRALISVHVWVEHDMGGKS